MWLKFFVPVGGPGLSQNTAGSTPASSSKPSWDLTDELHKHRKCCMARMRSFCLLQTFWSKWLNMQWGGTQSDPLGLPRWPLVDLKLYYHSLNTLQCASRQILGSRFSLWDFKHRLYVNCLLLVQLTNHHRVWLVQPTQLGQNLQTHTGLSTPDGWREESAGKAQTACQWSLHSSGGQWSWTSDLWTLAQTLFLVT